MRTQGKNPYYRRYRDRLPKSGLYPKKDVLVFYNSNDEDFKVRDVEVVYKPDLDGGPVKEPELYREFQAYTKRWEIDIPIQGHDTPAGVFGFLLEKGFESDEELKQALEEFSALEDAEWAKQMLEAFQ